MSVPQNDPLRGEIWLANFNPTRGREQSGVRPCFVVSVDPFNSGPLDLVIVIPITSTHRDWPTHVEVKPPEGGLQSLSHIKSEDIRSISKSRLIKRLGAVSVRVVKEVEDRLRILLGL